MGNVNHTPYNEFGSEKDVPLDLVLAVFKEIHTLSLVFDSTFLLECVDTENLSCKNEQ